MNKYKMFFIDALTNMHVGSGDIHYSVVDNMIQRHPVTDIPVIHASSIKGALREYFEPLYGGERSEKIVNLFGGSIKDEDTDKEFSTKPGHLIFFEANLLLLPLRASNRVFYYCTSPSVIKEYLEQLNEFAAPSENFYTLSMWVDGLKLKDDECFCTFDNTNVSTEIEDYISPPAKRHCNEDTAKEIKRLLQVEVQDIAIFNDNCFKEICKNSLPVIARNHLEDGRSVNLFYEEILPRRTKLYFTLGLEDVKLEKVDLKKLFDEFIIDLTIENREKPKVVQFGGNYSVGYGFSKVTEWKH